MGSSRSNSGMSSSQGEHVRSRAARFKDVKVRIPAKPTAEASRNRAREPSKRESIAEPTAEANRDRKPKKSEKESIA